MLPSLPALSTQPRSDSVAIEIKERIEENPRVSLSYMSLPSNRDVIVTALPTPKNLSGALEILKKAEVASVDDDLKQLKACDIALESFFTKIRHRKALHIDHITRIARLKLPLTQSKLFTITERWSRRPVKLITEEDRKSSFAHSLEERVSEKMLKEIHDKVFGEASFEERQEEQKRFNELAKQHLRVEQVKRQEQFAALKLTEGFSFLLYVLNEPSFSELLPDLFYSLAKAAVEGNMPFIFSGELVNLTLRHPVLKRLAGTNADAVRIRVKDVNDGTISIITGSRLLLAVGSGYFQSMLKQDSLPEIDLSNTSFDKQLVIELLNWLSSFDKLLLPGNFEQDVKILERLLTRFAGFALRNEGDFIKWVELRLVTILKEENLPLVVDLAFRFKLLSTYILSIEFINDKYGHLVKISKTNDEFLRVEQLSVDPLPPKLLEAINLLGNKINSVMIRSAVPEEGCFGRVKRFGRHSWARSLFIGQKVWDKLGGFVTRTGGFALTIFAAQKAAHHAPWPGWETAVVSATLGATFPCVSACFREVISLCAPRNIFISVPCWVPISQCLISSSGCFSEKVRALKERCLSRSHPAPAPAFVPSKVSLLSALPANVSTVDLSLASDFSDGSLKWLVDKHFSIEKLVISPNQHFTENGWRQLSRLSRLNHLKISLPDGEPAGALNQLQLEQLVNDGRALHLELEVSDSTLACHSLIFLKDLPENIEVHVKLKHDPLPQIGVLFESNPSLDRGWIQAWPGIISTLVRVCPQLTHLDCKNVTIDHEDFLTILKGFPRLRSLKMSRGSLSESTYLTLAQEGTQLEEIELNSNVLRDDAMITIFESCVNLRKVALINCSLLTNRTLEALAQLPLLTSCTLVSSIHFSNAGVQHLLDRHPRLEELCIKDCLSVTGEQLSQLPRNTSLPSKTKLTSLNANVKSEVVRMLDYVVESRSSLFVLFQFLVDNININSLKLFVVQDREIARLRTSQINVFGRDPFLQLLIRHAMGIDFFFQEQGAKVWYDNAKMNNHLLKLEVLESILKNYAPQAMVKIENNYRDFLRTLFSKSDLLLVDEYVKSVTHQVKAVCDLHRMDLRYFFVHIYAQHWLPLVPVVKGEDSVVAKVRGIIHSSKEKLAKEWRWNEDQRKAAVLACLFFNWTWINEYLFDKPVPPLEVDALSDDEIIVGDNEIVLEDDEKERKERKTQNESPRYKRMSLGPGALLSEVGHSLSDEEIL